MNATAASVLPSTLVHVEASPDCQTLRHLPLPSAEQGVAYAWRWWTDALAGLTRRHQLVLGRSGCYAASFQRSASLDEAFASLFDLRLGPQGTVYPFLHAQSVVDLLQAQVLADLGVNWRHVQHLRHRMRLTAGEAAYLATREQQLECRLARAVRIAPTEVLAIVETRICDSDGLTVASVEDAFVLRGLQVAETVQAEEDDLLRRAIHRMRRHLPEIDARAADVRLRQLYLAPDASRRFARVGGARAPETRSTLAARLTGRRSAAVQEAYLRHLVSRELAEWGVDQPCLQIVYASRAKPGQTLCLLLQGRCFELVDARGRLVAWGKA